MFYKIEKFFDEIWAKIKNKLIKKWVKCSKTEEIESNDRIKGENSYR